VRRKRPGAERCRSRDAEPSLGRSSGYPRVGYEIPITRLFYNYTSPRPSEEIKAELRELEGEIRRLLEEVLV
jgi:type I restriction enzyme M protein